MNRTLEKLLSVIILVTCLAGWIFAFNVLNGFSAECLKSYSMLLSIPVFIYYVFQYKRLKDNKAGFLFSDVRSWLMLAEWSFAVVGLIYLGPMHASLAENHRAAAFVLQKLLPLELLADWLAGKKGTFHLDYAWKSFLFLIPYTGFALLLGYAGKGFSLIHTNYPYPFMNADQLGWFIVWGNLTVIFVLMYVISFVFIVLDRRLKVKR